MKLRRYFGKRFVTIVVLIALLCISISATQLVVGGQTVGMKVKLNGVLVTSVESGSPAERAGLRSGDSLVQIGGDRLKSVEQLMESVAGGSVLALSVSRNGETRTVFVQPELVEGDYKLGAAVKDDLAGIGTVTYYDPETQTFGALGHGICDLNGATLLEIDGGVIVPSRVVNVEKSKSGAAGQLQGDFDTDNVIGTIQSNSPYGVFGVTPAGIAETVETASPEEITTGDAVIRANVEGNEVRDFQVEIVSKLHGGAQSGKDLLIRVTDPDLLAVTGGIVQGMSGSPILQNGKLIGAVTHVLLHSPEYGYGISIDRMLNTEQRSVQPTFSFSNRLCSTKIP